MQELEAGSLHRFQDWPNDQVPKRAAGVYTVWDGDRLLYVGMSGRAMAAEDLEVSPNGRVVAKGLWTRLNAHASGRRSGDQFCVYVCDRLWSQPSLHPNSNSSPAAGCRWTTLPEGSSATGLPTGLSSPPMGLRPRGWRPRFDGARCWWAGRT